MVQSTPSRWREATIGEIVELHDRRRIPISEIERSSRRGPYPYYGASGIIDFIDRFIFDGNYLLVSEDGENLKSRKTPIAFMASGKFWVNNHAHILVARAGVATNYFLMSFIENSDLSGYVTGTAQPKLSQANLKRIRVHLPSIAIQRKITAVLCAYDNLIENDLRRIEIISQMADGVFTEWFVKFRFPGNNSASLVHSATGTIPRGWTVANLFDVAEVTYGFPFKADRFSSSGGTGVIRIRDLVQGETVTYTTERVDDRYVVQNGDILVGMDGNFNLHIWTGGEAYLNQRVARFRPREGISPYYLLLALKRPIHFFDSTVVGTTVAHLSDEDLKSINILVPDPEVSRVAMASLDQLFKLELSLRLRNVVLRKTRDLLLPKLISGELDLSELDVKVEDDKL